MMTFDSTVHVGELFVMVGAGYAVLKGGIGMRDAVRDLATMVTGMRETQRDHEERIRDLEHDTPWPQTERRRRTRDAT